MQLLAFLCATRRNDKEQWFIICHWFSIVVCICIFSVVTIIWLMRLLATMAFCNLGRFIWSSGTSGNILVGTRGQCKSVSALGMMTSRTVCLKLRVFRYTMVYSCIFSHVCKGVHDGKGCLPENMEKHEKTCNVQCKASQLSNVQGISWNRTKRIQRAGLFGSAMFTLSTHRTLTCDEPCQCGKPNHLGIGLTIHSPSMCHPLKSWWLGDDH